jgi:NhaP-type Na+/H+ or K+/H+ antiporter
MTDRTTEYIEFIVLIALLLSFIVHELAKRVPLPYASLLLLSGFILRVFGFFTPYLEKGTSLIDHIDHATILLIFIPTLIFETAFTMDSYTFKKEFWQIFMLSTSAVVMTAFINSAAIMLILDYTGLFGWSEALLFGTILSATDHVAVVSLLKKTHTDHMFRTLIQGETLLNEGVVLLLFNVMKDISLGNTNTPGQVVELFFKLSGGGIALGLGASVISYLILRRIVNDKVQEINLMFVLTYLTYFIGESRLHVSGALSILTFGLFMASFGKMAISPMIESSVHDFWAIIAHNIEALIFVISGMQLGLQILDNTRRFEEIAIALVLYFVLHFIRCIVIFAHLPLLRRIGYGLTLKKALLLSVAGVKGTISLVLSLAVFSESSMDNDLRHTISLLTTIITTLSIILDTFFVKAVIKYLKISRVKPVTECIFLQMVSSIMDETEKHMQDLTHKPQFRLIDWKKLNRTVGPKNLLISTLKSTTKGEHLLKTLGERATIEQLLQDLRSYDKISDDEQEHELRRRLLSTVKGLYWHEFKTSQCSRYSARILIHSANRSLDDIQLELHDWDIVQESVFNKSHIDMLLRYSNLFVIGKYFRQSLHDNMFTIYDCASAFIHTHEEVISIVQQVGIQLSNYQIYKKVIDEFEQQINNCRVFLRNYISNTFPEIKQDVQTKKACYQVLYKQRLDIEEGYEKGLLDRHEYSSLMTIIDSTLKHVELGWKSKFPTLTQMLKECEIFKEASKDELKKICKHSKEKLYRSGEYLYVKGDNAGGIFIILKGRVEEGGDADKHDHFTGELIGYQHALSKFRSTTYAQAQTFAHIAFIPRSCFKTFLAKYEEKLWKICARNTISLDINQYSGDVSLLKDLDVVALIENSSFIKYKPQEAVTIKRGGFLMAGTIQDDETIEAFALISPSRKVYISQTSAVILHFKFALNYKEDFKNHKPLGIIPYRSRTVSDLMKHFNCS